MAAEDKALIASSDFDPTAYVQGMDAMLASLDKVIAKEAELNTTLSGQQKALASTNTALKTTTAQLAALDKTAADYQQQLQQLTAQQQRLQQQQAAQAAQLKETQAQATAAAAATDKYKTALAGIGQVAQQVKAAGGNLFNVASLTTQLQQVNQLAGSFRNTFKGKIDTRELDALEERLAGTSDEFERLREVVTFVQQKLDTLDPNSEEFRDLSQVVATGTQVLEEFDSVQDRVTKGGVSLRSQLRAIREELARMEEAGETGTERFQQLQVAAGKLEDQMQDTQQRIRVLASDTRNLDFGLGVIRGATAGYGLLSGAAELFGVKSEDALQTVARLNSVMAIFNGLQEIQNLLQKQSVVAIVASNLVAKAYTVTQRVLAATLGTTAAASKGLQTALISTGVGALVVGIGLLINAISTWTSKTQKQAEAQERLNEANQLGLDINQDYLAQLDAGLRVEESLLARRQAAQQKVRQSEVERVQEQLHNNEELRTQQQENLRQQVAQNENELENQREAAQAAQAQIDAIIDQNKAASQQLAEASNEFQRIAARNKFVNTDLLAPLQKTVDQFNELQRKGFQLSDAQQVQENNFQRDRANERLALRRAELAALEDFQKRLTDLRQRLLEAQNKQGRQDAEQLGKNAADNLAAELSALQRDVRLKNLTQARADVLKGVARQVADVELTTELREFTKKSLAAQQGIEDQLLQLRLQSGETRANLLRDQLEREAAVVEQEYRKEFVALEDARRAALQGVQDAFDQGLISPGQFERNTARVKAIYEQLLADLALTTARKREELARTSFELGQALLQQLFADSAAGLTEGTTRQVQALTARYTQHRITYERYQRELTAILRRESETRIAQQIAETDEELQSVRRRLKAEQDPAQQKALQDRIIALREQLAQLRRQLADATAAGTKADHDDFVRKVNLVASYAQAIGGVVDQVVRFWQAANEAEQKALDRSISLQETRVAAATRVAERGNAEYLRLEEDRLTALQLKQENAARRQLAINAVLQGSQELVAFTSALAQGIATGGPLGGIAIAAAILGVLASGYAIIQQLQAAQNGTVKLYKGKRRVTRDHGEPPGVDTVPALLTEGETVVSRPMAEAYAPTLDAMFDGRLDPGVLNDFVRDTRVGRRRLPGLASERVAEAHEAHATYDLRLLEASQAQTRQLQAANDRLEALHGALKETGVTMSINHKGFAVALKGALKRMDINKKV